MESVQQKLARVNDLEFNLYGKDFLLTSEKSESELRAILGLADALKSMHRENISARVFDTGLAISIFRDQSTRTRFSYA